VQELLHTNGVEPSINVFALVPVLLCIAVGLIAVHPYELLVIEGFYLLLDFAHFVNHLQVVIETVSLFNELFVNSMTPLLVYNI